MIDTLSTGRHTFGSASTRRQLDNRPEGPFTPTLADRPGEQVQVDSTPLDVMGAAGFRSGGPGGASPAVRRLREERRRAADLGAAMPGTPFDDWVERFGPVIDWPENLSTAPLIVDIPIGSDPHNALALAAVARTEPKLVIWLDYQLGVTLCGSRGAICADSSGTRHRQGL
ncbi:hypothetical protein [Actinomadura sp. B10D3]|uniref:hypothetical protein n=1 Tax=Actinomadura sp. B10D3 TaxID=3153557 RepID=UPI00325F5329